MSRFEMVDILKELLCHAQGWRAEWRGHASEMERRTRPPDVEPSARAPDILTEIANASDVVRRAGERSPHVVFVPLARGDELKAASFWFQSREFPTGLRYYGADVWLADVPRIVAGRKVHQA